MAVLRRPYRLLLPPKPLPRGPRGARTPRRGPGAGRELEAPRTRVHDPIRGGELPREEIPLSAEDGIAADEAAVFRGGGDDVRPAKCRRGIDEAGKPGRTPERSSLDGVGSGRGRRPYRRRNPGRRPRPPAREAQGHGDRGEAAERGAGAQTVGSAAFPADDPGSASGAIAGKRGRCALFPRSPCPDGPRGPWRAGLRAARPPAHEIAEIPMLGLTKPTTRSGRIPRARRAERAGIHAQEAEGPRVREPERVQF
jgi:hypothetical protein